MKSSETKSDGIRVAAARLRMATFATMAVMSLLYVAARFGLQLGQAHVEYRLHQPDILVARFFSDAMLILLLVALFRLTQMLARIAAGELFTAEVIGRFRSFALWLLVTALVGLAAPLIAGLIAPAGGHRLMLALDFEKIVTVGVTLVLFLLARLLERARRLDEEMREFV
jgi:hypothetical protein